MVQTVSTLQNNVMEYSLQVMNGLRKRQIVDLKIESLAFGGRGIGRTGEGMVVFVEDALPGQRIRASVTRIRKRYVEARLHEVVEESPHAVKPRCTHFGPCGGCRLQHLDYKAQLEEKEQQVREALIRIGGFTSPPVEQIIPSPRIYGYRNKMEYSFGNTRWLTPEEMDNKKSVSDRDFALGLHPRGRWYRTIHLDECHLPSNLSVEILKVVQKSAVAGTYKPFSTGDQSGYWRFLVVREGVRTGQWLVDIITSDDSSAQGEVEALARHLKATFPQLTSVIHTISSTKSAIATGEKERILIGPGYIEEEVGGLRFRISPRAFFQTNTEGAERLYEEAIALAAPDNGERVYDVYCGTGTIALLMAARAGEVIGFELEPSAVIDARRNAEINDLDNALFVEGDAAVLLREGPAWGIPDLLVLDPPRAGLHPDMRKLVHALGARRMVYISCNPTTLSGDLAEICHHGYTLESVKPLDMFPHTPHVECVSSLILR